METICFVPQAHAENFLGTVIAHLPYKGPNGFLWKMLKMMSELFFFGGGGGGVG